VLDRLRAIYKLYHCRTANDDSNEGDAPGEGRLPRLNETNCGVRGDPREKWAIVEGPGRQKDMRGIRRQTDLRPRKGSCSDLTKSDSGGCRAADSAKMHVLPNPRSRNLPVGSAVVCFRLPRSQYGNGEMMGNQAGSQKSGEAKSLRGEDAVLIDCTSSGYIIILLAVLERRGWRRTMPSSPLIEVEITNQTLPGQSQQSDSRLEGHLQCRGSSRDSFSRSCMSSQFHHPGFLVIGRQKPALLQHSRSRHGNKRPAIRVAPATDVQANHSFETKLTIVFPGHSWIWRQ
jgi:hypothetical protein